MQLAEDTILEFKIVPEFLNIQQKYLVYLTL